MFRFLCPLCGAKPRPRPLREYIEAWAKGDCDRVCALVVEIRKAFVQFAAGESRWKTKKLLQALDHVIDSIGPLLECLGEKRSGPEGKCSDGEVKGPCPVCQLHGGIQEEDPYFTDWACACGVQVRNLLYESGLILWGVIREVPTWCDAEKLSMLDGFRISLFRASKSMRGLECPICHRPTNHLYGAERQFCRWCLDMCGGFGLGMKLGADGSIELTNPDPASARLADPDLIPPQDVPRAPRRRKRRQS